MLRLARHLHTLPIYLTQCSLGIRVKAPHVPVQSKESYVVLVYPWRGSGFWRGSPSPPLVFQVSGLDVALLTTDELTACRVSGDGLGGFTLLSNRLGIFPAFPVLRAPGIRESGPLSGSGIEYRTALIGPTPGMDMPATSTDEGPDPSNRLPAPVLGVPPCSIPTLDCSGHVAFWMRPRLQLRRLQAAGGANCQKPAYRQHHGNSIRVGPRQSLPCTAQQPSR